MVLVDTVGEVRTDEVLVAGVHVVVAGELTPGDIREGFVHFVVDGLLDGAGGQVEVHELVFDADDVGGIITTTKLSTVDDGNAPIQKHRSIKTHRLEIIQHKHRIVIRQRPILHRVEMQLHQPRILGQHIPIAPPVISPMLHKSADEAAHVVVDFDLLDEFLDGLGDVGTLPDCDVEVVAREGAGEVAAHDLAHG